MTGVVTAGVVDVIDDECTGGFVLCSGKPGHHFVAVGIHAELPPDTIACVGVDDSTDGVVFQLKELVLDGWRCRIHLPGFRDASGGVVFGIASRTRHKKGIVGTTLIRCRRQDLLAGFVVPPEGFEHSGIDIAV